MAKTVLHLIETSDPDGAERMMVHLATRLGPEYRSEAALIRNGWLGSALRSQGIPVTMLRYESRGSFANLYDLATLRDLLTLIRERHVAILHTHEFFMNTLGLIASRLTGVPVVATVHERNYYPDRLRRRVAYRLFGRFAQQMVTVSEGLRDLLTERIGIPPDRIRVVPNGVTIDEIPSQETVLGLRQSLGFNQQSLLVGTVGRLHPKKGHKYLIEGAVHVVRRFPGVVFLIVGGGELHDELEAQARALGVAPYFRFLGHREDVRDLLPLLDIFVLPSLSEGMPLALLEAMAAGIPPVATRIGGVNEVVEDGKTALIVPPKDTRALADSIITLLEDRPLAQEMGEAARQVATRRFSVGRMVEDYKEIYTGLIGKSGAVGVQR